MNAPNTSAMTNGNRPWARFLSISACIFLFFGTLSCVTVDPWAADVKKYDEVKYRRLDLRGMTTDQVMEAIGPPRYRATLSSSESGGETWSYVYPKEPTRINLIIENDRVMEVEIRE